VKEEKEEDNHGSGTLTRPPRKIVRVYSVKPENPENVLEPGELFTIEKRETYTISSDDILLCGLNFERIAAHRKYIAYWLLYTVY
jgi:hypothetical protein